MEREEHCKVSSTPVLKCLCARLQSAECDLGGACSWSHTAVLAVSLDVQCSVSSGSMLPFLLCIVFALKYAPHTVAVKFCNTCPMSTAGAGEGGGAGAGGGAGGGGGGGEGGAVNIAHLANSCSLPCAQILHLFPPIPDGWEM